MFQLRSTKKPECGICMQPYNSSNRFPMIISSCGHTFCLQCCKMLSQCPVCRTNFSQSALVKNFAIVQIMQQTEEREPVVNNSIKQESLESNLKKTPVRETSQKPSTKSAFCCLNDGCKVFWDSNFHGKCGCCRYDRSGCWKCNSCQFIFCSECGKNSKVMNLTCPSDGSQVSWDKGYYGKCGNCRYQRNGCWSCRQCGFFFCTQCGQQQKNVRIICIHDGSRVTWSKGYSGKCGDCRYQRSGCWKCNQCNFFFCTQCGKSTKKQGIVCINDGSQVVWQKGYFGKCGDCRYQRSGCWLCKQCGFIFCTQCGKNGKNLKISCISDGSKVLWQKGYFGKCGDCRYERSGCWQCIQCKFVFCTECAKNYHNIRIRCFNDQQTVYWEKSYSGKCAVCRYDRSGCWACRECGVKFCTECAKNG